MCFAGLQMDDTDQQRTMAPELTFNVTKQMKVGFPENFSLGIDVVIYIYCKDLANYLGINN